MKRIILSSKTKSETIVEAIAVLSKRGIVVYPTETCYGVGVDATNQEAVKKLLLYKERPEGKAISIAVSGQEMADKYVVINQTAENLYKNFLPGPITVISKSRQSVADGIEAEDKSLGVRIPDYSFTLELIKQFGKPITATSANMSGRKTPYSIEDILENIPEKKKELIDLIIDAGELPHNPPSTVVDTRMNDEKVLRQGAWNSGQKTTNTQQHISHSEAETQLLGEDLMIENLHYLKHKAVVFALQGELGAGKTQFAKGIAKALGITENVSSPTFTIVKEYEFPQMKVYTKDQTLKGTLYHIDTWRVQEEKELADLGFEEMLKPGNVVVIEWAEKVFLLLTNKSLFSKLLTVRIKGTEKNIERSIIVSHKK